MRDGFTHLLKSTSLIQTLSCSAYLSIRMSQSRRQTGQAVFARTSSPPGLCRLCNPFANTSPPQLTKLPKPRDRVQPVVIIWSSDEVLPSRRTSTIDCETVRQKISSLSCTYSDVAWKASSGDLISGQHSLLVEQLLVKFNSYWPEFEISLLAWKRY